MVFNLGYHASSNSAHDFSPAKIYTSFQDFI